MAVEDITYFQRSFISNPEDEDNNPMFELPPDLEIFNERRTIDSGKLAQEIEENHAELKALFTTSFDNSR